MHVSLTLEAGDVNLSYGCPCSHLIQQATTEKKRNAAAAKRPRTLSASSSRWVFMYQLGIWTSLTPRQ